MTNAKTTAARYLTARAGSDPSGRIAELIRQIAKHVNRGDCNLAEDTKRTLDDFVWRPEGPSYTIGDVVAVAETAYEEWAGRLLEPVTVGGWYERRDGRYQRVFWRNGMVRTGEIRDAPPTSADEAAEAAADHEEWLARR